MDEMKLWKTLWKTAEGRPGNASRRALNRFVPQALAETRAASPSARISGFSGVNLEPILHLPPRQCRLMHRPVNTVWITCGYVAVSCGEKVP